MSVVDPRTVDVLLAARDAVGPDTWTQGTLHRDADGNDTGASTAVRSCLSGHLNLAIRASHRTQDAVAVAAAIQDAVALAAIQDAVAVVTGTYMYGNWNDERGRTWQDVWDALDAAAALAKEQSS